MTFISRKNLAVKRDVSLTTEKKIEAHPMHPKPIQITEGRLVWVEEETDEFDRMLIEERARGSSIQSHNPSGVKKPESHTVTGLLAEPA